MISTAGTSRVRRRGRLTNTESSYRETRFPSRKNHETKIRKTLPLGRRTRRTGGSRQVHGKKICSRARTLHLVLLRRRIAVSLYHSGRNGNSTPALLQKRRRTRIRKHSFYHVEGGIRVAHPVDPQLGGKFVHP